MSDGSLQNLNTGLNVGTFGNGGYGLSYPIYASFRLDSTDPSQEFSLFDKKVGETVQNAKLTLQDTNMRANQVPVGQKYKLYAMQIIYLPSAGLDAPALQEIYQAIIRNLIISFKIEDLAPQFQLCGDKFFGAMQASYADAAFGNGGQSQALYSGVWKIGIPIELQQQVNWSVVCSFPGATPAARDGDRIKIYFENAFIRK